MIARSPEPVDPPSLPRPRRLIGVSLLPAAATLGNLLCGFAAVFFCLLSIRAEFAQFFSIQPRVFHREFEQLFPTHIAAGAYMLVLAMIFDALDGRLARMTRRTSEFGAQLDSIADIVSFGLAPAVLIVTMLLRPAPGEPLTEADASRMQFRVGMACAVGYVSCAAIRLARYNVENVKTESALRSFSGLPSPGAAALVVSLLLLHESLRESLRQTGATLWGVNWANGSRWVITLAALAAGLLMISRVDYVHVFNVYLRRKHPPTHLIWLVLILGLASYWFQLLFVVLALAYVISGPAVTLVRALRGRRAAPVAAPGAPAPAPARTPSGQPAEPRVGL